MPPPGELGQASPLYSLVCHPGLKNKIKLVLLNYLLSAKSRWFSLREKGIVRISDETLTQTDNGGARAHLHVDADTHAQPRTRKTNKPEKFKGGFRNAQKRQSQRDACTRTRSRT